MTDRADLVEKVIEACAKVCDDRQGEGHDDGVGPWICANRIRDIDRSQFSKVETKAASEDANRLVTIVVGGSGHSRTALEWVELARADLRANRAPEAGLPEELTKDADGLWNAPFGKCLDQLTAYISYAKALRAAATAMRTERDDYKSDYFRRHNDAVNHMLARIEAELALAESERRNKVLAGAVNALETPVRRSIVEWRDALDDETPFPADQPEYLMEKALTEHAEALALAREIGESHD